MGEDKYTIAMEVITKAGVEKDKDTVLSIAESIRDNRFLIEYNNGNMVVFVTWADSLIDGKRYIFVNNCWVDPVFRSAQTLIRIRTVIKFLLKGVYKFYWHNRKKEKMIYRR